MANLADIFDELENAKKRFPVNQVVIIESIQKHGIVKGLRISKRKIVVLISMLNNNYDFYTREFEHKELVIPTFRQLWF